MRPVAKTQPVEIHPCIRLSKIPTTARTRRCCASLVCFIWPALVAAQSPEPDASVPLREADVIELSRKRSPAAQVAVAIDTLAEARGRSVGLLPNPGLSWARETIQTGPAGGRGSQDILTAVVPIDLARPFAERSLAASESAWSHAEAALARADGMLAAVEAFYEVVIAERRVEVLTQAVANLEEASRVLGRREAAGSASGYESSRLSIEYELSRSQLAEGQGALVGARVRLSALLGARPESLRVTTELPLLSASAGAALSRGVESRTAVRQARASLRFAGEAEGRAGWVFLPTVELGAGLKRADNFGASSGYGYVIGVSLELPLFDHGQAQRARARAQRALSAARSEALVRRLDSEVQSALIAWRAAQQELSRFEAQTAGQVEALLVAAQSGYREGERTIVELLDAQRAQTAVAERRLHLLWAAKRAEARLRAAAGDLQ